MPESKPLPQAATTACEAGPGPAGPATRRDTATATWLALIVLTLVSALASAHGAHPLWRLAAGLAVALLCAVKGRLLLRGYLHARDAGPVFDRLVRLFAALAPALLGLSALLEAWRTLAA